MVLEKKIPRKTFGTVKRRAGERQGQITSLRVSLETSHNGHNREPKISEAGHECRIQHTF